MVYNYFIGVIGIIFGIIFFFLSLYQIKQRKSLQNFIRSQAWYLYKKAKRLLVTIQSADQLYHENNKNSVESEIVKKLAKSEALGIEILDETIRHIQFFESDVSNKMIQQWEDENKHFFEIKENKNLFEKLAQDHHTDET